MRGPARGPRRRGRRRRDGRRRSGLDRVEYWLRPVGEGAEKLDDDSPELARAPWLAADLAPPPDWEAVLPDGTGPHELLGFDSKTGEPKSWPTRYGMASWQVVLRDLEPGEYEIRFGLLEENVTWFAAEGAGDRRCVLVVEGD